MHTLSFTILDDLKPMFIYSVPIEDLSYGTIKAKVADMIYNAFVKDNKFDPTYLFVTDTGFILDAKLIADISRDLVNGGFLAINRIEKYYVVGFAIDYTRFEVYSKDCDKAVIDWEVDNQGPIKGIITDPDYNLNPVIKLLNQLN